MSFTYTQEEIDFLAKKDKKFKEAIEKIGFIEVAAGDPFTAAIKAILAPLENATAVYEALEADLKDLTPRKLIKTKLDQLQDYGMPYAQAVYLFEMATKVYRRNLDLAKLAQSEFPADLVKIPGMSEAGVAVFKQETAGASLEITRDNELILKGMRMLYRHRAIDDAKFERYAKRYQPHGKVAALYLAAIANGALEGVTDPQPKAKK